jgi:hypothetical protein
VSALSLALIASLLAAAPAAAYQRDEHYYTVRLSLDKREGGDVAAMCAQLADEAPELNAIAVYRRVMRHPFAYGAWSMRGTGPDETVGVMVETQQLLHGLTGGSPKAVRAVAAGLARQLFDRARAEKDPAKKADTMCAVGFALHLYGDSFAHTRIHNSERMYGTGIGHFFDATKPDLPLYSAARFDLWREYINSAPGVIPEAKESLFEKFFSSAGETRLKARSGNNWGLAELWKLEHSAVEERGLECRVLPHNSADLPCAAVMAAATKDMKAPPTCEGAWSVYRESAQRAFEAWDADPAHAGTPSRDPIRPLSTASPFSGVTR